MSDTTPVRVRSLAQPPADGSGMLRLTSDVSAMVARNFQHIRRIPEKLLDVTLQPIMFVLLFAYVFGGVISVPGGNYHEYLIGGIIVQSLGFGLMGPATSISNDLKEGVVDRFLTLPINRAAYLVGHMFAELASLALALVILSITGLIVGWRIHTGIGDAVAGYALLLFFAQSMLWLGTFLGLVARSADAAQGIVFVVIFPLSFIATTFVPIQGFASGLRPVAEYSPFSALATAARQLFGNPSGLGAHPAWPLAHPVISSLAWCIAIMALAMPLALYQYRLRVRG